MSEQKSPTDAARRRDRESWIDQQIREAQERGEFDNLPGKGRPLDLTPNPYAQDQELAFKILKDAGFAPEWIELDKAIRGKLEAARARLARRWEWCQARLRELEDEPPDSAGEPACAAGGSTRSVEAERNRVLAGWGEAITVFEEEVGSINKEIAELNLKVPHSRFQRPKVDTAREVRGFDREIRGFDREVERLTGADGRRPEGI